MEPQFSDCCDKADAMSNDAAELDNSVEHFFDRISEGYDAAITRAIPPYVEMMKTVLGYCFMDSATSWSVLELGCGTGNLSLFVKDTFPNAHLTLVDLSADMLHQAGQKLERAGLPKAQLTPVQGGFMDLDFPPGQFDLVVSSMALHHLLDVEKPVMYARMFKWLKPGGLFRCADETLSLPQLVQEQNLLDWEVWARSQGATTEDVDMWTAHAVQHDHYAPLAKHFQWMQEVGFTEVDCYWRKLMWTSFGARKPI